MLYTLVSGPIDTFRWYIFWRGRPSHGEMVRALGGWSGGGSTSDDYGSGFTPERLYGAIKAVRYDGLDLSHLCLR